MDPFIREDRIRAARATKVAGLVRALSEYARHSGEVVTADELLSWTKSQWETLAKIGMVNPPGSRETIDMVVARVREQEQPAEDFALRPLASFLDKSAHHVFGYRLGGAWYLRVAGVTGTGKTFAEASADVCNKLMSAQSDSAPDCGRCNGTGEIGEGHHLQTCPVCRGSTLGHGTVSP